MLGSVRIPPRGHVYHPQHRHDTPAIHISDSFSIRSKHLLLQGFRELIPKTERTLKSRKIGLRKKERKKEQIVVMNKHVCEMENSRTFSTAYETLKKVCFLINSCHDFDVITVFYTVYNAELGVE